MCTVYSKQMIDIWENPTKSSTVNLPDLTASLESMMAAEVRSYLTKMDLTPWLGGALAALHSSLMEDVWPASMAAFSCFSESTSAPDTRHTNLESEVCISGEMGAPSYWFWLRLKNSHWEMSKRFYKKTSKKSLPHILVWIIKAASTLLTIYIMGWN